MDTRIAEYIMILLKSRITIVWSWGSTQYVALYNGLMWHVEGFLLKGWVKVLYNEGTDAFDVYFLNNKKKLIEKVEKIYIDSLIDCIDRHIERDGSFNYEQRVKEQYAII